MYIHVCVCVCVYAFLFPPKVSTSYRVENQSRFACNVYKQVYFFRAANGITCTLCLPDLNQVSRSRRKRLLALLLMRLLLEFRTHLLLSVKPSFVISKQLLTNLISHIHQYFVHVVIKVIWVIAYAISYHLSSASNNSTQNRNLLAPSSRPKLSYMIRMLQTHLTRKIEQIHTQRYADCSSTASY